MRNFSLIKYLSPVFVETGTFVGDTVNSAKRCGFKKIYSVELSRELFEQCQKRFATEIGKGRVELYCGDSVVCLRDILRKIDRPATFWLDAHYSGGETARGDIDVPLLKELDAIAEHPIKTHTILIDDVRLFGGVANEDWSEIHLDIVVYKIKTINQRYLISYDHGLKENDVLVAQVRRNVLLLILGRTEEVLRQSVRWFRAVRRSIGSL